MSFHLMVGLGAMMMLLMLIGAFYLLRGTLDKRRWWLKLAVFSIPLPIAAVELGWMTAEVGRQPWIVQGLLKTSEGTSPAVTAGDIVISLVGILLLYGLLFALWLYSLTKEIRRGPEPDGADTGVAGAVVADAATADAPAGGN
jgi:cytochrome d ubiquinol oxidase subunit I